MDYGLEAVAAGRELVSYTDRSSAVHDARDDAFRLELAQALRQQAVREPRNRGENLVETARCAKQGSQNRTYLAAAN